jgi:DNA helicase-2/ATP-dependent DNA helicase PcrA
VYAQYIKLLDEQNLLDFNDLLLLTKKIFDNFPDAVEEYKKIYKYILVDEFQDTNEIQFSILKYLVDNGNVFAVGDPDQTIYTWRGAYPQIFSDFQNTFTNTQMIVLHQNYRSTQNIINAANSLINNNPNRIKKSLSTNNDDGLPVHYYQGNNQELYIATKIKELINEKKYAYSDIAILYRVNYLSQKIEEILIQNSIPYKINGGINFFQRSEIKDLLAYLKIITKIDDEIALLRIINVPRREIGKTTISQIKEYAIKNNLSFIKALYRSIETPNDVP